VRELRCHIKFILPKQVFRFRLTKTKSMKKLIFFILIFELFFLHTSLCQLPLGDQSPDFTLNEIPEDCNPTGDWGDDWNLYEKLNEGKHVIIDFSTADCVPCWEYHEDHFLESLWTAYGPDGDNTIRVVMIEAKCSNSLECICGSCTNTIGDWTEGTTYPIFDPESGECEQIRNDFDLFGVPTFYAIHAEHKTIWDVEQSDHEPTIHEWETWLFESFEMEVEISSVVTTGCSTAIDISVEGGYTDESGSCDYLWSNGEIKQDISGQLHGSYSVTVTDDNGYFLVKEIPPISANYDNCTCVPDQNVDLSSTGNHTVADML